MADFYHIMIIPKAGITPDEVEAKINLALDWFRFSRTNWVVYTNKDAEIWFDRLNRLVKPGGKLFICKLDVEDRQGWVSKKFWEWLRKDRSREQQISQSDLHEP